jgi:hypothetical protein
MTTPYKNDYAMGITLGNAGGRKLFLHNGIVEGFRSVLAYMPNDETVFVLLSNLETEEDRLTRIGRQLGAILDGESLVLPTERREVSLPTASLQKVAGRYQLAPGATIVTTPGPNGSLRIQLPDNSQRELLPESPLIFFARSLDGFVEFVEDLQGQITGIVLHIGDDVHRARRLPDR